MLIRLEIVLEKIRKNIDLDEDDPKEKQVLKF